MTPASNNLNANPLIAWKHVATQAVKSGNLALNTNEGFETLTKALAYAVREEGHPAETVWHLLDELCVQYKGYDQAQYRLRFDSFVASQPHNPVAFATVRLVAEAPSKAGAQQPELMVLAAAKERFLFVRNVWVRQIYIDLQDPSHPMALKAFEGGHDYRVVDPVSGRSTRLGLVFTKHPHLRQTVEKIIFDLRLKHGITTGANGLPVWNTYRAPEFPLSSSNSL